MEGAGWVGDRGAFGSETISPGEFLHHGRVAGAGPSYRTIFAAQDNTVLCDTYALDVKTGSVADLPALFGAHTRILLHGLPWPYVADPAEAKGPDRTIFGAFLDKGDKALLIAVC